MSKHWAYNKRLQEERTLRKIEDDVAIFENDQGGIYISEDHKKNIAEQYSAMTKILKDKEEIWRLRSRAIWK